MIAFRKFMASALFIALLCYTSIQLWFAVDPAVGSSGWGTIRASAGDMVNTSVHLRQRDLWFPIRIVEVAVDPEIFRLNSVCMIQHDNSTSQFSGYARPELPEYYQARCRPLNQIPGRWQTEYGLAMSGQILTPPTGDPVRVTLTYRVLGWPHRVDLYPKLFEPASDSHS